MSTVEGRVALITGASSGIGAATARTLAEQGARVALASRRGTDEGIPGALARPCDVRDPAQVESLVAETLERFGRLDIVVANAGVGAYGDFLDISPEHLEEMIDVNVKGLLYTVRASLPHLLASPAADLVVVASVAGQRAPEGESVYAASKFAQVGFMRSLDHELHRRGVRCSTIAPGGVWTEFAMGDGRGRSPDDADLPGMMRAQEIADAVVHAVTRPRTHRVLESTILPMSDDSMN
ncbi:MAG TPA: SDR family oxidoreductase [Gaiellales bacterium]|nr:SDR family oxidoreductase [Gaiellales bacterium]